MRWKRPSTKRIARSRSIASTPRKTAGGRAQVVGFGGIGAGGAPGARRDGRGAAMDLVRDEMAQAGRAMDPAAMALLVDRAGGDVTKLRGDLERLLLYTEGQKRVSREDVA